MRLILVGFGTVGRGVAASLLDAGRPLAEANGAEPAPAMPEVLDVVAAEVAIRGIVNGTCNFILSEMEAGAGYDTALTSAQEKGSAETDPSGDVEGWDAAAKALILANCVLGAVVITGPGAGRRCTGHSVVVDLLAIHRPRRAGR